MAPRKKQIAGLQRINGEWVSDTLNFAAIPADWSEIEASQTPEPWLDKRAHIHALRRMAILADVGAVKLLLSLEGPDGAKQDQILAQLGRNTTADRVDKAVHAAQAFLTICPPRDAGKPRDGASHATEVCWTAITLHDATEPPRGEATKPPRGRSNQAATG